MDRRFFLKLFGLGATSLTVNRASVAAQKTKPDLKPKEKILVTNQLEPEFNGVYTVEDSLLDSGFVTKNYMDRQSYNGLQMYVEFCSPVDAKVTRFCLIDLPEGTTAEKHGLPLNALESAHKVYLVNFVSTGIWPLAVKDRDPRLALGKLSEHWQIMTLEEFKDAYMDGWRFRGDLMGVHAHAAYDWRS